MSNIIFATEEIQVYVVGFDIENMKPFAKIEKIPSENSPAQTEKIHSILKCEGIDIVDYSNDIAIIVSDRGMFTDGLPLFEVICPDNTLLHLAGSMLFVKNKYTAESVDIGELSEKEIQNLILTLNIKVKGVVTG
ncbi:hypothetical protein [Ureibacillus chungkukjangi]|uniref:hypothetical protein n=1 Tax=Ureibacillus chungkukjangi TaxID=1202712 RepID=UPI00200703AB|nr:hypothetical protein [Ureibacillus chungkukjangi]